MLLNQTKFGLYNYFIMIDSGLYNCPITIDYGLYNYNYPITVILAPNGIDYYVHTMSFQSIWKNYSVHI